jgi:hypothetical protein
VRRRVLCRQQRREENALAKFLLLDSNETPVVGVRRPALFVLLISCRNSTHSSYSHSLSPAIDFVRLPRDFYTLVCLFLPGRSSCRRKRRDFISLGAAALFIHWSAADDGRTRKINSVRRVYFTKVAFSLFELISRKSRSGGAQRHESDSPLARSDF